MQYSTYLVCSLLPLLLDKSTTDQVVTAAGGPNLEQQLGDVWQALAEQTTQLSQAFLGQPVDPEQTFQFEQQLDELLRETGRQILQAVSNHVEPVAASLPKHVQFEASLYTRLNRKTAQNVWTLFGQICLQRVGYRPSDKSGDATLFPLALALGLIQGATPALAERAAGLMSDTGMTQQTVLRRLRQDHGVGWGVKKLRQVTAWVSKEMAEQRHEVQVNHVLALLRQATESTGSHKPVLSLGRDGITLGLRCPGGSLYEVASCGMLAVLERIDQIARIGS